MTRIHLLLNLQGGYAIASIVLGVVFLVAVPGLAQTTFSSLTGSITDVGGAAVPNVPIEATHVRSNYKYTTLSNEVGNYTLPQLREGEYTLRATAPGFRVFVAQSIQLAAREERRIDIRLEVGPLETLVEVTAGATLIETETA
ncbi:MAG TPA: carboxypeptidase-like regulatory domain-containing protein, partial [Terriglobia bacterium]|nr:carboxypeptidase-like regulatory domain-containing protein [Terriglobia bacterium]